MRLTFRLGGELEIGRLGFGAMRLGDTAVLRRALELGVSLIDTADVYGPETSELLIAEALHPYPAGLVIAKKGGLNRLGDRLRDGRPEYLRSACEASLRRLRLERIDLYSLHRHDPEVPIEESVGALEELRQEGKIRLIGLSNVSLEQLLRVRSVVRIAAVQTEYNRGFLVSEDVLRVCEEGGIAFMPWGPLGEGLRGRPRAGLATRALARDRPDPRHIVRDSSRGEHERALEPGPAAGEHRLAMRHEHELDGEVEQHPQLLSEPVVREPGVEVAEPGWRADSDPSARRADEAVAGNERAMLGDPDDRFAGAWDLDELDFDRLGRPVAGANLGPAAPVPVHGRDGGDGPARDELVQLLPRRDERIDQHDRFTGVVEDAADALRPVGRAVGLGVGLPVGVRRGPAVESRAELVHG